MWVADGVCVVDAMFDDAECARHRLRARATERIRAVAAAVRNRVWCRRLRAARVSARPRPRAAQARARRHPVRGRAQGPRHRSVRLRPLQAALRALRPKDKECVVFTLTLKKRDCWVFKLLSRERDVQLRKPVAPVRRENPSLRVVGGHNPQRLSNGLPVASHHAQPATKSSSDGRRNSVSTNTGRAAHSCAGSKRAGNGDAPEQTQLIVLHPDDGERVRQLRTEGLRVDGHGLHKHTLHRRLLPGRVALMDGCVALFHKRVYSLLVRLE